MQQSSHATYLIYILTILLAVSPSIALGDGNRNLLLIAAMGISPILFFIYPIFIPKIDIPLIILCLMMIFFPWIRHSESMRWSTVLYTCMFALYLMAYVRVLYSSTFSKNDMLKLLKGLLIAYSAVLLIQQFCVLTGLPIFNLSNYDPGEPWKLNSLMSEPSHSARIIPILMYFYISLTNNNDLKSSVQEHKLPWIAFLWTTLTMGSATAFLFIFIVLFKFVNIQHIISLFILVFVIGIGVLFLQENKSAKRLIQFTEAVISLDEKKMIKADHSASTRVVPSLMAMKYLNLDSLDSWTGHGVDYDASLPKMHGVAKGSAGAFYIWINFGFLVAALLWAFTFSVCYIPGNYVTIAIWILTCVIVGGTNTQLLWLVLALTTSYKYVVKDKTDEDYTYSTR